MQAEWHQDEKGHTKSTCEALTRLAEFLKADILVLGSFGRKGEKLYALLTPALRLEEIEKQSLETLL